MTQTHNDATRQGGVAVDRRSTATVAASVAAPSRTIPHATPNCATLVCRYPVEHRLAASWYCHFHYRQLTQPFRRRVFWESHDLSLDAPIGEAIFLGPHADFPVRHRRDRVGYVVCSRDACGATWVGIEGDFCTWCLTRWRWQS